MIGRSVLAYIPVNIANIIVSFGTIIILTRLFTGAEFGIYALAVVSLQFTHMGLLTWLEAAMARFQARAERDDDVNSHLKTLAVAGLVTSVISLALILSVIHALPLDPKIKIVLTFALGSTCLTVFFNIFMEAHRAAHRITRYSAIYTGQTMLAFAIGIFLILATPLREQAPFVGVIIATCMALIVDLPFMMRRMKGGRVEAERIKTYFTYGMPICISLLLTYALNSADLYLITGFLGSEAAGQYNAGYNLSNRSLDILFIWLGMAVTPIMVTALEKDGVEKSKTILSDYAAALLWITLPAATGIALVAEPAGFILGEAVRDEAVKIMPLIAFTGVLNGFISYYAQRAFMLSGRTGMFVWAMVPPVLLNIGLNILWIPAFGLMGAVYATVASYALGLVLSLIIGRRYYPLPLPFLETGKIIVCCVVMAAVVSAVPISDTLVDVLELLIKATIGAVVYAALSFMLNTANCRTLLRTVIDKYRTRDAVPLAQPIIEGGQ